MLYENYITGPDASEFKQALINTASALGYNPDWLAVLIYGESRFNAKAVNTQPSSVPGYDADGKLVKSAGTPDSRDPYTRSRYRATGISQFMPATAKNLGTSNQALFNLSRTKQLNYTYAYYKNWAKAGIVPKNVYEFFLINFYPVAVGKPDNFILGSERSLSVASSIAKSNPGLDYDGDGYISIKDYKKHVDKKLSTASGTPYEHIEQASGILGVAILSGLIVWFTRRRKGKKKGLTKSL